MISKTKGGDQVAKTGVCWMTFLHSFIGCKNNEKSRPGSISFFCLLLVIIFYMTIGLFRFFFRFLVLIWKFKQEKKEAKKQV